MRIRIRNTGLITLIIMCIFISALTPEDSDTEKEEEEGQKKEEEDKEGETEDTVPPPLPIQVGCTMYSL